MEYWAYIGIAIGILAGMVLLTWLGYAIMLLFFYDHERRHLRRRSPSTNEP
jgi:hypothetical protein